MILLTYMCTKADLPPPHFFWKDFSFGRSRGDREIMYKACAVADLGEGPGGPGLPLFLDQTETRRAEKNFFSRPPPSPYLRVWMTAPPPLSKGLDPPLQGML